MRIATALEPYHASVQAVIDRLPRSWLPPFRLFTTLARHPVLFECFINGAPSYLPNSHVGLRQREILLLRTTARCGCAYEWGMRVHYFAAEAGLSEAQIQATVEGDGAATCWLDDDRVLIHLADSLHDTCGIGDALWAQLKATFSDEALLELVMMAGYYRTVSYLANALQLPLEPNVGRPFPVTASEQGSPRDYAVEEPQNDR